MAKDLVKVSYGGAVNATAGEVVDYKNKSIIADLLKAGYIEEVKEAKAGAKPAEPSKTDKPKTANNKRTKKDNKEG